MRRRRRKRRDWLGWALIVAAFAGLGALALGGFALRAPPIDPETLCRTDRPIVAHTVILVDATDKLAPRHRKRLRAAIDSERARLAPYDKLTILRMSADTPNEPRLIFSKCLPRDAAHSNPMFENPGQAQAKWDEEVGKALRSAASRAAGGASGDASPIVQSLFAIAADPDFAPAIANRRVVLVSDLLEHEPGGFSLYRDEADFAAFKAGRAGAPAAPDLEGVVVRIAMLDREGRAALQEHAKTAFWGPFLEQTGASAVNWDPSA